jgi:predicted MFS family arabinose efflux permease
MVAGMAAMTVSVLALAVFVRPDSSYLVLVGPLLGAGVGTALAFPTTASATMQAVTPDQMGPAGGVGTVAFQLGAALGVSLVSGVQLRWRVRLCGDLSSTVCVRLSSRSESSPRSGSRP